jgi:dienelactone hydrolase
MRTRLPVILICVAATVAGCGGSGDAPATTAARVPATRPPAPTVGGCVRASGDTRLTAFRAGHTRIPAAVIGDGAAGVVFLNTAQNDLCAWEPFAREIARHGARAVLFEYAGNDHVAEALAAVRMLRAEGAAQVSLVGGSLGAMVAIAAAARAPRQVRAIVSLSPARRDPTGDYLRPARRNRVPSLYVSARNDGWTTFGAETRRLSTATPARINRLVLVDGDEHAIDLLTGPAGPRLRRMVIAFVQRPTDGA